MSAPWYTTQWKSDRGRPRSIVAAIGYVVAGVCALTLVILADDAVRRLVIGFTGIVMLWLGVTLALTVRHRHLSDR